MSPSPSRTRSRPVVTGLSGNEIFCLDRQGMTPSGVMVGNSVQSLGVLGGLGAAFRGVLGGEVAQVTRIIEGGRRRAFARMMEEAERDGAHGVVGVSSELRSLGGSLGGNAEFLFVGSGVRCREPKARVFACAGSAQELYCHMDAGYVPLGHAFGNIAYAIGAAGGILGGLKTMARGEIREFSDVVNETRHVALRRLTEDARGHGANAVVGIRVNISRFRGVHEMLLTGTAAHHPLLGAPPHPVPQRPAPPNGGSGAKAMGDAAIASSDLTGEEAWAMAALGYAPVRMVIAASVYSLGVVGGLKAAFRGLVRGEIPEMTRMVYDAREGVFDRLRAEAARLGAEEIVGIKSFILELGSGLIEFLAVGTAVTRIEGMGTVSGDLPAQAIIRDRDTWVSGAHGFDVEARRAGG